MKILSENVNFPDCQIPLFVWQKAGSQYRGSLTGDPEEATPRVEQVRFGAFVRQFRIAPDQSLQNSFVILRRALMQLQLTPVGTLASTANGTCDLNQ